MANNVVRALPAVGRKYRIEVPQGIVNPVFIYLWGAGGGAGTNGVGKGGKGAPGALVSVRMILTPGDILEITPGAGGGFGTRSTGGTGGSSGIDTFANNYGGGDGGSSGSDSLGGSGGGGGAATFLEWIPVTESTKYLVAVAAGGAGGGGGSSTNTNTGESATTTPVPSGSNVYVGQDGESSQLGNAGGGGGGGGHRAGDGGNLSASGGQAGFTGASFVNTGQLPNAITSWQITNGVGLAPALGGLYNISPGAVGGDGGPGGGGYAVVDFSLKPLPFVKLGSTWVPVDKGYVKVAGQWRPIQNIYTKVDNKWRMVSNGKTTEINFTTLDEGVEYTSGGSRAKPTTNETSYPSE
jgi:hypothetical protein